MGPTRRDLAARPDSKRMIVRSARASRHSGHSSRVAGSLVRLQDRRPPGGRAMGRNGTRVTQGQRATRSSPSNHGSTPHCGPSGSPRASAVSRRRPNGARPTTAERGVRCHRHRRRTSPGRRPCSSADGSSAFRINPYRSPGRPTGRHGRCSMWAGPLFQIAPNLSLRPTRP